MNRLNNGQRIVLVIGFGIGLVFVGEYITNLNSSFGWVAYAPLSDTANGPLIGLHPWARMLIWMALVAVWLVASLAIFRQRNSESYGMAQDSPRRSLSFGQRIVCVVALGVALTVFGRWIVTLGSFGGPVGMPRGSATYGSSSAYSSTIVLHFTGMAPWERMLLWLCLVAVWTVSSMFILRSRLKRETSDEA